MSRINGKKIPTHPHKTKNKLIAQIYIATIRIGKTLRRRFVVQYLNTYCSRGYSLARVPEDSSRIRSPIARTFVMQSKWNECTQLSSDAASASPVTVHMQIEQSSSSSAPLSPFPSSSFPCFPSCRSRPDSSSSSPLSGLKKKKDARGNKSVKNYPHPLP